MRQFCAVLIVLMPLSGCETKSGSTAVDSKPTVSAADTVPMPKPGDLPNCPGMDIRRPAGSNCYGIFPTVCGADKAKAFIGRVSDAALRETVTRVTGNKSIRWIMPGEAVIQNLDPSRLNMELDAMKAVKKVDCY